MKCIVLGWLFIDLGMLFLIYAVKKIKEERK